MSMSTNWDEYHRRVNLWHATGDSERLALTDVYQEAWQLQETDTEQSLALFTRGRNEARRLNEPWWVLFFENLRLETLVGYIEDFARALPLVVELMVQFNAPGGRTHEFRHWVLRNILHTYISIDAFGYRSEIEQRLCLSGWPDRSQPEQ